MHHFHFHRFQQSEGDRVAPGLTQESVSRETVGKPTV